MIKVYYNQQNQKLIDVISLFVIWDPTFISEEFIEATIFKLESLQDLVLMQRHLYFIKICSTHKYTREILVRRGDHSRIYQVLKEEGGELKTQFNTQIFKEVVEIFVNLFEDLESEKLDEFTKQLISDF